MLLQDHIKKYTLKAFIILNAISFFIASIVLIIYKNDQVCIILFDTVDSIIYSSITLVLFDIITLVIISYLFYQIRKSLTGEIKKITLASQKKRFYMKKLISYPIIYIAMLLFNCLILFQIAIRDYSYTFLYIRCIALSFFPLVNSLMYGLTTSSARTLCNLCIDSSDFEQDESFYHEMRRAGEIWSRYFFDLLEVTEKDLIN